MDSNNLLIVGLGNPGKEYEKTRHNCGADFVEQLSLALDMSLTKEKKFSGLYGSKLIPTGKLHLCIPSVYVNESGKTVSSIKNYLKLSTKKILVVHDELDLPLGKLKLKESGGHGGHNGLRNVIEHLNGDSSFKRLRIGIGHPEKEEDVVKYVLTKGSKKERRILTSAFEEALPIINTIIEGNWQKAMLDLHS